MERIPSEDAQTAEGVLKQLCRSLQLLASPAQAQIRHFPVPWIVLTDEMADDLGHWAGCVSTYWELPQEQKTRLTELDGFLSEMSGSDDDDFWTDEALFTDSRWEKYAIWHKQPSSLLDGPRSSPSSTTSPQWISHRWGIRHRSSLPF